LRLFEGDRGAAENVGEALRPTAAKIDIPHL
jgi:hypothetical protein